ncbi:Os06g0220100 [Oryza sativa Japonica Group]|uniref:Os06g0220100 protein n=1 Tax=Oryza sativa subsp. japonica TaxID=39947 RepID=Q67X76_ORYSJ|nr:unknown protein [Oryza sativa Japonica Group]BAF19082.1 Os06g0220100 [Oryza sativa Japonica Group]|eukprot:NP_001057168.1 Os06g0220100 [Oryza sativa Japonica Group]
MLATLITIPSMPTSPLGGTSGAAWGPYTGWWNGHAHCPGHCVAELPTHASERTKSVTTAFCAGVNRPYQRIDTGMSPLSTAPLWYVSWFGWGLTKDISFLSAIADTANPATTSIIASNKLCFFAIPARRAQINLGEDCVCVSV